MPYYGAGDYYAAGSYYQAGGLGSFFGGLVKKVAGTALSVIPGGSVVKTALNVGSSLLSGPRPRPSGLPQIAPMGHPYEGASDTFGSETSVMIPAYRGPGKDTGRKGHFKKDGTWTNRARPRMQPTNTRALRRAGRRVRGFLRIARALGALPVARGKGKRLFRAKRK